MKYYAVRKGRVPGVYLSWPECSAQVTGYSGPEFKSFSNEKDATAYIEHPDKLAQNTTLVMPCEGECFAYVDGSYNLGRDQTGYGMVIITDTGEVVEKKGAVPSLKMRQVNGEITAALEAVLFAVNHDYKKLVIFYDCQGIENWVTGAWQTTNSATSEYARIMNSMEKIVSIRFEKVRAHTGTTYNENADRLAKEACGLSK